MERVKTHYLNDFNNQSRFESLLCLFEFQTFQDLLGICCLKVAPFLPWLSGTIQEDVFTEDLMVT